MGPESLPPITTAVAPVVMVSAAGLLFIGVQSKNLHLADRIRALAAEYRALAPAPAAEDRRGQIADQLRLFEQRLRLSQRALELLYLAIICFVLTSFLLASTVWLGVLARTTVTIFVLGVALLLMALVVQFLEMRVGLKTIQIEVDSVVRAPRGQP